MVSAPAPVLGLASLYDSLMWKCKTDRPFLLRVPLVMVFMTAGEGKLELDSETGSVMSPSVKSRDRRNQEGPTSGLSMTY